MKNILTFLAFITILSFLLYAFYRLFSRFYKHHKGAIEQPEKVSVQQQREGLPAKIRKLRDKGKFQKLIRIVKYNNNRELRWAASNALGDIGPSTLQPIFHALKDEYARAKNKATNAFRETGRSSISFEAKYAIYKKKQGDSVFGEIIGRIENLFMVEENLPWLHEQFLSQTEDWDQKAQSSRFVLGKTIHSYIKQGPIHKKYHENVEEIVKKGFAQIGPFYKIEYISIPGVTFEKPIVWSIEVLKDDVYLNTREGAVRALTRMGEMGMESLIQALKGSSDNDHNIQGVVADAFAKIGLLAVEPLISVLLDGNLKNDELFVQRVAALAFGKTRDGRAHKPLTLLKNRSRIYDADPAVEWALRQL